MLDRRDDKTRPVAIQKEELPSPLFCRRRQESEESLGRNWSRSACEHADELLLWLAEKIVGFDVIGAVLK